MSTIAMSGVSASTAASRPSTSPAWAATSSPASSSSATIPRGRAGCRPRSRPARQLRAHGRPGAGRADHEQAPVERLDAVGEPAQAAAARLVGAADAVVGDLDAQDAGPQRTRIVACARGRTWRRWPAPRRRRSRRRARPAPAAAAAAARSRRGSGRARAWRASPGRRQAVLEHRGVDAAGELAQLRERVGELVAGAGDELGRGGVVCKRFWSRRSCSAMPTRRCCAPSCRLRSSRRRSASPAATIRSRDALISASCGSRSASSRALSIAIPAAAVTASTSSGSSSRDAS